MTIKELRKELKFWGLFWASKESLQGYASVSVTARCCEVLQTGIWASSDKHLFNSRSDSIHVPHYIVAIDNAVTLLPLPQRMAINRRYIKQATLTSTEKLALLHAESQLLSSI